MLFANHSQFLITPVMGGSRGKNDSKHQIIPNRLNDMIFKRGKEVFLPNDAWLRLMFNEGSINSELPGDQGLLNMFINYLGFTFPDFVNGCCEGGC